MDYKSAGVDVKAAESAIENVKDILGENSSLYAGIFPIGKFISSMKEPVLVSSTDGIGTKLELIKKEKRWDIAAQDLVAMNLNDLVCMGAKPLFFLDYYSTDKLSKDEFTTFIKELAKILNSLDCRLIGGETAELNGLFKEDKLDIAGFVVGIVDRRKILSRSRVKKDDVVIGLKSSGIHSNGFTLIRRLLESGRLNFSQSLITPTKLYVNQTLKIKKEIKAAAHITGGGIKGNLKRIIPKGLKAKITISEELPEIFKMILKAGIDITEAFNVFNMGIGMLYITSPEKMEMVKKLLKALDEEVMIMGKIVTSDDEERVEIRFNGRVI